MSGNSSCAGGRRRGRKTSSTRSAAKRGGDSNRQTSAGKRPRSTSAQHGSVPQAERWAGAAGRVNAATIFQSDIRLPPPRTVDPDVDLGDDCRALHESRYRCPLWAVRCELLTYRIFRSTALTALNRDRACTTPSARDRICRLRLLALRFHIQILHCDQLSSSVNSIGASSVPHSLFMSRQPSRQLLPASASSASKYILQVAVCSCLCLKSLMRFLPSRVFGPSVSICEPAHHE